MGYSFIFLFSMIITSTLSSDCSIFESQCLSCNPHNIDSSQRCDYIECCCCNIIGDGLIDYLDIIYCRLSDDKRIYLPLLVIYIIYLLFSLAILSHYYFAELMHEIATYLRLHPNVAGATFVAWGNGITTISSSITAISAGGEQTQLGLGSLFGAAVFNISFICGTIAWMMHNTKPKLDARALLRDAVYLVFVCLYVIMATFVGTMSILASCFLLASYILYMLLIWMSNVYAKYVEQKQSQTKFKQTVKTILKSVLGTPGSIATDMDSDALMMLTQLHERHDSLSVLLSQSSDSDEQKPITRTKKNVLCKIMLLFVGCPLVIMQILFKLTVPLPNHTHWHDVSACLHCITVPVLFYFVFIWDQHLHQWYHYMIPVSIGITLSVVVAMMLRFRKPKSLKTLLQQKRASTHTYGTIDTYRVHSEMVGVGRTRSDLIENMMILEGDFFGDEDYCYQSNYTLSEYKREPVMKPFFLLLGFVALVSWIRVISGELVCVLNVLGVITQMDLVLLGTFVLSLGHSLPDLMNNVSIAMKGNEGAKMALAACFGGASLQICIGFSLGTVVGCMGNSVEVMDIVHSKYMLIGCLFTIISCGLYAAIVSCNHWTLSKLYTVSGYISYAWFILFILVS
eukprot:117817_1